jgi:hypothetical protein
MLDETRLLLRNISELLLLKIDYDSLGVNAVSKTAFGLIYTSFIVDQLNHNNFLMYSFFEFATCNLIDDKIVCSPRRQFDFFSLYYPKLVGNTVSGLEFLSRLNDRSVWECKYCEINVTTLKKSTTNVGFNWNNRYSDWNHTVNFLFSYLISIYFRYIAGMRIGCILLLWILIVG